MISARPGLIATLLWLAGPAGALDLSLPGQAELAREFDRDADTYFLPTAPLSQGRIPSQELEGRVLKQAWHITGEGLSTLGLTTAIREQLQAQGYDLLLDCTGEECGGFDFRFGIDVLPAPDMFVDLFDFRFLSARNADQPGAQYVSALVSHSGQVGYVQLVIAAADGASVIVEPVAQETPESEPVQEPDPVAQIGPDEPEVAGDIAATLTASGHVILADLVFATGSSSLEDGAYASLTDLADFLKEDPARRAVLVGHTDAVGKLEGNIKLSRARASSVMERLIQDHGVDAGQLAAEGMGYLSPVASNATEQGRHANRRVEAVLLNTE